MFPFWKQKGCAEILHENKVRKYINRFKFVTENKNVANEQNV